MAETDSLSTSSSRFRTNKAPGFAGGSVSRQTGNYVPPNVAQQRGTARPFTETKSPIQGVFAEESEAPGFSAGGLVKSLAPAAGSYLGGKAGEKFGGAIGEAAFGDSGSVLGEKIPSFDVFDTAPSNGAFGGAAGSVAGEAATASNFIGNGRPVYGAVNDFAGELAGEIGGEFAGQVGGEAAGAVGGEVAGEAAGSFFSSPGTSTWGGAAGSGIGAGIGTLIATGDVGKAVKSGAATAAGTAIGQALIPIPGLGGMIGGALGGAIGGRVICTYFAMKRELPDHLFRADMAYTQRLSEATVRGYHFWAVPYVRLMRRSRLARAVMRPIAIARAEEIGYRMGVHATGNWLGWLVNVVGVPFCFTVGLAVAATDWRSLYTEAN